MDVKASIATIKRISAIVWDWANDSPSHFALFALGLYTAAFFWKILFWYLVFPGSFALTWALWTFYKKNVVKKG